MTPATPLRYTRFVLAGILLLLALVPGQAYASVQPPEHPWPGCTTFYAYDGQNALAGNNEDFINPLTYVWFIPASPGRYGRVYFGYDDFLPEGGVNDQGLFFDEEGLPYKAMPVNSEKPHVPSGEQALMDEILSRSATVQEAIDLSSRWRRLAGEYSQTVYGDRHGDSVIIDGDTILRKQGRFQLATNFRLVEHPSAPWPAGEERYGVVSDMLAQADHYSVDLLRRALDAAANRGEDSPTLYSQVYELNTGVIHLYQFHDFEHEVVLNLADELAKGPHILKISSLFPPNAALNAWGAIRIDQWKTGYEEQIDRSIQPGSQDWMSGEYDVQEQPDAGQVKIYSEKQQLYMQMPNRLPIELYPVGPDTVFHRFLNGIELNLTFQRNASGQVTRAVGTFSFQPYNISLPYDLTPRKDVSHISNPGIIVGGAGILLILLVILLAVGRRRKKIGEAH